MHGHDVAENMLGFMHIVQRDDHHFGASQAGGFQDFAAFGIAKGNRFACVARHLYAGNIQVKGESRGCLLAPIHGQPIDRRVRNR